MSPELSAQIVRRQLGDARAEVRAMDPTPVPRPLIGQVHRAVTQ